MSDNLEISLSFTGNDADKHLLDFYDAAEALQGFQRYIALTTHFLLNDEIIVQAPKLKGAELFISSPEAGSWKVVAYVVGILGVGTTMSKDTVLGHLYFSAYDYVISKSLGFPVDYDKSLGESYSKLQADQKAKLPKLSEERLNSLMEKCENSIISMHRPIISSCTASRADIKINQTPITGYLSQSSYNYMTEDDEAKEIFNLSGNISSYNINTFRGRIYITEEKRPIPFEIIKNNRDDINIIKITQNLVDTQKNKITLSQEEQFISFSAYKILSQDGRLKKLNIIEIH
jgi:hypothetical protein